MSSVQASESDRPSDPTPAIETLPAPIALKDENQLGPLDTGVPSSTLHKLDLGFLPIPKHLQYDPEHPAQFSLAMNVTFGIASTFIVANLYYCQPLLMVEFSWSFGVTYREVSNIPTLVQAGYGIGILFITPLGDLVRRRPLLILLNIIIASLTIGLAITKNLVVFEVLSFLIGIGSVAPQILTPLPVDLAPPERRASALSIVLSGLLFGVLIARVLAGVVAQFVTWRVVYYVAIGVQCAVLVMLYWTLPDYPAKNKGFTYFGILYSMAKFTVTEPLLVQTILITIPSSACLTNWWATLTFLLGAPPVVQLLDSRNRSVWPCRHGRRRDGAPHRTHGRQARTVVRDARGDCRAAHDLRYPDRRRRTQRCGRDHHLHRARCFPTDGAGLALGRRPGARRQRALAPERSCHPLPIHRIGDGHLCGLEGVHGIRLACRRRTQPWVDGMDSGRPLPPRAALSALYVDRMGGRLRASEESGRCASTGGGRHGVGECPRPRRTV